MTQKQKERPSKGTCLVTVAASASRLRVTAPNLNVSLKLLMETTPLGQTSKIWLRGFDSHQFGGFFFTWIHHGDTSVTGFLLNKSHILNISTKYNCDPQVFPLIA